MTRRTLIVSALVLCAFGLLGVGIAAFVVTTLDPQATATAELYLSPATGPGAVGRDGMVTAVAALATDDAVLRAAAARAGARTLAADQVTVLVQDRRGTLAVTVAARDQGDAIALADALSLELVARVPASVGHAAVSSAALPGLPRASSGWALPALVLALLLLTAASASRSLRRTLRDVQRTVLPRVGYRV